MVIEIVAINKALIRLNRLEIAIVIVAAGLLKGLTMRGDVIRSEISCAWSQQSQQSADWLAVSSRGKVTTHLLFLDV